MQCLEVIRKINDPQEPAALLETGLCACLNSDVGYESLANCLVKFIRFLL